MNQLIEMELPEALSTTFLGPAAVLFASPAQEIAWAPGAAAS